MKLHLIKKHLTCSIIFSGLLIIAFFAAGLTPVQASDDCESVECRQQLAEARAATAKYHNLDNALADGFINTRNCVQHPQLGAMGIHFVRPDRIGNPSVNVSEPEAIIYIPDKQGKLHLVAFEYIVPAPLTPTVPSLFGQTFHFNPARNEYALHVWAWRHNPSGMFADFNPELSCPQ
jgi:hypothetical protein